MPRRSGDTTRWSYPPHLPLTRSFGRATIACCPSERDSKNGGGSTICTTNCIAWWSIDRLSSSNGSNRNCRHSMSTCIDRTGYTPTSFQPIRSRCLLLRKMRHRRSETWFWCSAGPSVLSTSTTCAHWRSPNPTSKRTTRRLCE